MIMECGEGFSRWQHVWSLIGAGISMWKWIVKVNSLFWRFGFVDPGGGWVGFWDDFWVKGVRLRVLFPRVRAVASFQNPCLFDVFPMCLRSRWELPMRISLRGGALEEYQNFPAFLRRILVTTMSEGPPMISWTLTSSTMFSEKSMKAQLSFEKFPGMDEVPSSTIWSKVVPLKIQGFMWLCFLGRISTLDVLKARGFQLPNRCSLCLRHEESVSHIFLHCSFVSPIWSRISSRLSIFGPMPATVADWISGWKGLNCDRPLRLVVLHSFLWHVWLERNDVIFRDVLASASRVFFRSIVSCLGWLRVHAIIAQHDFECWMRQLTTT
ncbi:hypothetical protein LINPERPRIM_LOCUS37107 [Linum perenne]